MMKRLHALSPPATGRIVLSAMAVAAAAYLANPYQLKAQSADLVLYGTGSGVAKDEAQARKLFERAAEAGNPRGVSNLAALGGGGGASADPARARELLAKAAETNAEAQSRFSTLLDAWIKSGHDRHVVTDAPPTLPRTLMDINSAAAR
jgi:TPR repeat protein